MCLTVNSGGSSLGSTHPTKQLTLAERPNFQPLPSVFGQLERPGEGIGFRPGIAEVVGVEPAVASRPAARRAAWESPPCRATGWSPACGSLRVPQSLSSASSRYQPSGSSTSLTAGSKSGRTSGASHACKAWPREKHVALHPDGLFRRVVRAQVAATRRTGCCRNGRRRWDCRAEPASSVECGLWKGVMRAS